MAVKKPKKPTREETTRLKTQFVRTLINEGKYSRGEIKRLFSKQFDVEPRAAERFMTAVYDEIRETLTDPPEQRRSVALSRWQSIYSNKTLPWAIRCRALENMDRIEGNHAPVKQAVTDTTGKDVPPDNSRRLTIAELDAELAKFATDDKPEPA